MLARSVFSALCIVSVASAANATILTFDDARDPSRFGNFGPIPNDYGDNVATATDNDYAYDLTYGATPNITATFDTNTGWWPNAYGNLVNLAYANGGLFSLTLTADAGHTVSLHGFDMAGWLFADYTIASVSVLDGDSNVLFNQNEVFIRGSIDPDTAQAGHTSFVFNAPLTAQTIVVLFDAQLSAGANMGIDNIAFEQDFVPTPASSGVLALAALGMLRRRRA